MLIIIITQFYKAKLGKAWTFELLQPLGLNKTLMGIE